MYRIGIAGVLVGLVVAVGSGAAWLSRAGLDAQLRHACREEDDRPACCALAGLLGDADDPERLALVRHACVALDPRPSDPLRHECACMVLLETVPRGPERDALQEELVAARCAHAGGPCPEERSLRDPPAVDREPPGRFRLVDPPAPTGAAAAERGIVRDGRSFTIDADVAERFRDRLGGLMSTALLGPTETDGRRIGVYVGSLVRGSLLDELGFESGDILRAVGDIALTDAASVARAYESLEHRDHLTLALVRAGSPVALEYDVR